MLACQMAAVHLVTMSTAAGLTQGANAQHDLKVGQLNKLTRTFATQMEALKRYRSKGEQRITVEHVDVHDGGQAVVGAVGRC
jgi:urease accessory protein UreH